MIHKGVDVAFKNIVRRTRNRVTEYIDKAVFSKRNGGVRAKNLRLQNPEGITCDSDAAFGKGSQILLYTQYLGSQYAPSVHIGRNFHATRNLTIQCANRVDIGDDVLVASDVFIIDYNHGMDPETASYLDNPLSISKVIVEDGVWIGNSAILLPGARVGKKSIIAAGAVVVGEIPPYCIAAGVPAKVVKVYDAELHKWVRAVE